MMCAPGACELSLYTLLLLCFGSHAPGPDMLVKAPSFFSLSIFFLLLDLTADGAINRDRVKHIISSQLLLALAISCKGERL
jgi:hypothetical protein